VATHIKALRAKGNKASFPSHAAQINYHIKALRAKRIKHANKPVHTAFAQRLLSLTFAAQKKFHNNFKDEKNLSQSRQVVTIPKFRECYRELKLVLSNK
jgi:hypothetical protein